jgi:hypothetical protein
MDSPEFEQILASLQAVVRRAYVLGRTEALKRVVEVMQTDETSWKPLALTASPAATASAMADAPVSETADLEPAKPMGEHAAAPAEAERPAWWARPPRAVPSAQRATRR